MLHIQKTQRVIQMMSSFLKNSRLGILTQFFFFFYLIYYDVILMQCDIKSNIILQIIRFFLLLICM